MPLSPPRGGAGLIAAPRPNRGRTVLAQAKVPLLWVTFELWILGETSDFDSGISRARRRILQEQRVRRENPIGVRRFLDYRIRQVALCLRP